MKRRSLLATLGGLTLACLLSAVAFLPFGKTGEVTAKAEPVAVDTVAMQTGASVRVPTASGDYAQTTGLRFTMYVSAQAVEDNTVGDQKPEVGLYVAKKTDIDATKHLETIEGVNALKQANAQMGFVKMNFANHTPTKEFTASWGEITFAQEVYVLNVVNSLPESLYGEELVANGYLKTSAGEYLFATNAQTRAVATVASEALKDEPTNETLQQFVNAVVSEENFKFENEAVTTDMYKSASLEELVALQTPALSLNVTYESDDAAVVAVEEGKLVRKGLGTANITATIGTKEATASVTIVEPSIVKVDEHTQMNIENTGVARGYVPAGHTDIADFEANGYTGNAKKLKHARENGGYYFVNPYTVDELNLIANDYESVSLWIAMSELQAGEVAYFGTAASAINGNTFAVKAGWGGKTNKAIVPQASSYESYEIPCEAWHKMTISIADYISLVESATDNQIVMFVPLSTTSVSGVNQLSDAYFYIGDITFEKPEEEKPSIIIVDETSHFNIENIDVTRGYVPAGSAEIAGFAGDYEGNAKRFGFVRGNASYHFINPYTVEELEEIGKTYKHVSVWIALSKIEAGEVGYFGSPSNLPNSFAVKAGWGGRDNKAIVPQNEVDASNEIACETWHQMTITIEDYIALVNASTDNKITLFRAFSAIGTNGVSFSTDVYYYIGDITFEL